MFSIHQEGPLPTPGQCEPSWCLGRVLPKGRGRGCETQYLARWSGKALRPPVPHQCLLGKPQRPPSHPQGPPQSSEQMPPSDKHHHTPLKPLLLPPLGPFGFWP